MLLIPYNLIFRNYFQTFNIAHSKMKQLVAHLKLSTVIGQILKDVLKHHLTLVLPIKSHKTIYLVRIKLNIYKHGINTNLTSFTLFL
jgi:hypothetical protein